MKLHDKIEFYPKGAKLGAMFIGEVIKITDDFLLIDCNGVIYEIPQTSKHLFISENYEIHNQRMVSI